MKRINKLKAFGVLAVLVFGGIAYACQKCLLIPQDCSFVCACSCTYITFHPPFGICTNTTDTVVCYQDSVAGYIIVTVGSCHNGSCEDPVVVPQDTVIGKCETDDGCVE